VRDNGVDQAARVETPGGLSRRVVVVDADEASREATELLLRREEYWTVATDDPAAAEKLARVEAADIVAVDLDLGVLEAVPRWQRRQGDSDSRDGLPYWSRGYAVLRALHADSSCARFPMFRLKTRSDDERREPPCRFGLLDYLPKATQPRELIDGLESVFRDVVEPAHVRDEQRQQANDASQLVLAGPAPHPGNGHGVAAAEWSPGLRFKPFEAVPRALRSALLADPDVSYRRFVRGILAEHGFVVHEASSFAETLELATARRPWLILSEVDLPDQSGFELCARIRNHGLLRRTPLAFLSAWDDPERRYAGLRLGADDYLVKPITPRELVIRLELLLKRYTDLQSGTQPGSGFHGNVELVGAAGMLQFCHLNRLTGILTVRRGAQLVRLSFQSGEIVDVRGLHVVRATADVPEREDIVYALLGWPSGQFEFVPMTSVTGTPIGESFDGLLLEACRRRDEQQSGRTSGM